MTHVTCRLTAKNRDQLRNPTLGSRVCATFFISFVGTADVGCKAGSIKLLGVSLSVRPIIWTCTPQHWVCCSLLRWCQALSTALFFRVCQLATPPRSRRSTAVVYYRWSSSSVYSTILSCGSISDTWYLFVLQESQVSAGGASLVAASDVVGKNVDGR